jgi:ribosomal protein S8
MPVTDKIANVCSLISMGQKLRKKEVVIPLTKYNVSIVRAFLREGLIKGFKIGTDNYKITLFLIYKSDGTPLIKNILRESKSKKYSYYTVKKIKTFKKSLLCFFTTTKGVISNNEALFLNEGGKLIMTVVL